MGKVGLADAPELRAFKDQIRKNFKQLMSSKAVPMSVCSSCKVKVSMLQFLSLDLLVCR